MERVAALIDGLDLSAPEKAVLQARFGIPDGKPKTLEEICQHFNLTREQVRALEAPVLRQLRRPPNPP